ncbi:hypothetical protein L1049_002770 [Liquidambar formosana]|uniref:PWWP domain-containing protein n=1 Tax=Liquidambar formosana TaxID=63359 RepID=A0AAP0R937_LIQFO
MERFEVARKTLAECSTLPAKPQAPDDKTLKQVSKGSASPGSNGGKAGSASGLDGSVARTQENGGRVSDDTNGGDVSGPEDGFPIDDAKMTGGSSNSLKIRGNKEEVVVEHGGRSENVNGSDSVWGVKKDGEKGVKKTAAGDDTSLLIGGGSGKKVGSPAIKEGPRSKSELKRGRNLNKKRGYEENGGDPDSSMLEMSEKKDEEDEDVGDEEYEYAVGDFVWGKIKSHPWWPGQIYDPADASGYAAKYSQRDRFLVAYFGDGTFAWCYPSQLKPFEDNFEQMSEQSNSKHFVKAVEAALDEFCRVVEFEMTCSCVLKENHVGTARPLAVNAGIKGGVFVPEGGIGKHSISQFEPAKFLADLRYIAQVVSVNSLLELNALKSQLSAFYCAKGGYELPKYTEPQYVVGLEDNIRSGVMNNGECGGQVDVPIQGPFEEDLLSLLQKRPSLSEDKLYQRRKQKSIAEIMGGEMDVKPKNSEDSMAKEETHSGGLASTSSRKKKKSSDEAESVGGDNLKSPLERRKKTNMAKEGTQPDGLALTSSRKNKKGSDEAESDDGDKLNYPVETRKKAKLSGASITTENKVPSVENAGGGGNKETKKGPVSRERKGNKNSRVENNGSGVKEETENGYKSRERKKSKYLSPPYTSINRGERNSSSKKDSKAEFLKVTSVARVGERMSKAAGKLIGSPPISKLGGETDQENLSREHGLGRDTPGSFTPETPKQDRNKIIDPLVTKQSANKVLSEIRSAALNPLYVREAKSFDMIREFFSALRSSIFRNGSNYKTYNKGRPGRKRKSLDSESGSLGKHLNQTAHDSLERKLGARNEKREAKLDTPTLKRAAGASDMKKKDKETGGKASSAALLLTYGPGVSLPSKDDLIATYSKFGSLNELKTEVLHNSSCAQVVFANSSDAEKAFNDSMKSSSSGDGKVSYRLRYLMGSSRIRKLDANIQQKASSLPKEGGKTPENSPLQFVRQKLETMTSMLEKSDGNMSQEMKINLESEMKGLLEKVSTMAESSSP